MSAEAGARYSTESKNYQHLQFYSPVNFGTLDLDLSKEWDSVTPRFAVDYRITDDALVYASAARGFRPGTFGLTGTADYGVDPEFIWNYELGVKTDWFDNRLRANAAIFFSAYEDLQLTTTVQGISLMSNASESTIQGVELELLARPLTVNLEAARPVLATWPDDWRPTHYEQDADGNVVTS